MRWSSQSERVPITRGPRQRGLRAPDLLGFTLLEGLVFDEKQVAVIRVGVFRIRGHVELESVHAARRRVLEAGLIRLETAVEVEATVMAGACEARVVLLIAVGIHRA